MFGFNELFEYHMQTKHSYLSVRQYPNRLDWENQPKRFKFYPKEYTRIALDTTIDEHLLLYLIGGITAKKSYPGVEYFLRVNPSAGALYPNEVYVQSRNNKHIPDGIYHLEIATSSLVLLHNLSNDGLEPYLGFTRQQDGFVFLISSIYYRSAWKYKNRAFRYCLLDAGHLLGCMEASSYLFDKNYHIVYDFDKKSLNSAFSFDEKEFFTSAFFMGTQSTKAVSKTLLHVPTVDGSGFFEPNRMIENAYEKSAHIQKKKLDNRLSSFVFEKKHFKEVIFKRRSSREFFNKCITKMEFESIFNILTMPIPSDCDEVLDIYCIMNNVEGMQLGLMKNGSYIKEGDFKAKAGYLCLEQDLGRASAVTFFITSSAKQYQAVYQKAGVIGHRLYLASNYLGIGCSGIGAYYDDEVCECIGENTMVLYALAIGK